MCQKKIREALVQSQTLPSVSFCMTNLHIRWVLLTRKMKIKHRISVHITEKFIHSFFFNFFIIFFYFYSSAVRTDAVEVRTVPHTVPLRGGAPQKHTCAYCVWHKVFLLDSRRRVTADIKTRTAMKPLTCSRGALRHKLDTCSRLIFQKLIRIYFCNENWIC